MHKATHENEEAHETNLQAKSVNALPAILVALMIMLAGNVALHAQNVQGVINGRNGATMTLQTTDTPNSSYCLPQRRKWTKWKACSKGARNRWP